MQAPFLWPPQSWLGFTGSKEQQSSRALSNVLVPPSGSLNALGSNHRLIQVPRHVNAFTMA
jgi:hypothetical protein